MEYDPQDDPHLQDADEYEHRRLYFPESIQEGREIVCRCGTRLIVPELFICGECPSCGRVVYGDE